MTINELLIIYLSLGAPVAVYYFQRQTQSGDANNLAKSVLAFVLWPATFVAVISRDFAPARVTREVDSITDVANDHLLQKIYDLGKRDLGQIGRSQETAQFREMLERYTGLLSAVNAKVDTEEPLSEFYVAAGHPNPRLAAAVHLRRVSDKLHSHSRAASLEVRQFFAQMQISPELRSAIALLAENLMDRGTAESVGGNAIQTTFPPLSAEHFKPARDRTETARAA
jgi:hypothetical protein